MTAEHIRQKSQEEQAALIEQMKELVRDTRTTAKDGIVMVAKILIWAFSSLPEIAAQLAEINTRVIVVPGVTKR